MSGWLPFRKAINETILPPLSDSPRYNPFSSSSSSSETDTNDEQEAIYKKEIQALNFLRDNIDLPPLTTSLSHPPAALNTPVFLGHGTADMTVDVTLGEDAASTLRRLGMDVTWRPYGEFGHWFKVPDEIDDIVEFLGEKMGVRAV